MTGHIDVVIDEGIVNRIITKDALDGRKPKILLRNGATILNGADNGWVEIIVEPSNETQKNHQPQVFDEPVVHESRDKVEVPVQQAQNEKLLYLKTLGFLLKTAARDIFVPRRFRN